MEVDGKGDRGPRMFQKERGGKGREIREYTQIVAPIWFSINQILASKQVKQAHSKPNTI